MSFLHGIEVIELDVGARPIQTSRSAVIGLVGTAPKGPVNAPTLVAGSRKEAIKLFGGPVSDANYSIPDALDAIFDQTGALVVVINVLDPENASHRAASPTNETLTIDSSSNQVTLGHFDYAPGTLTITTTTNSTALTLGDDYTVEDHIITFTAAGLTTIDADTTVEVAYNRLDPSGVIQGEITGESASDYEGIQALLASESTVRVNPRLLVAPGYTHEKPIVDSLLTVANRLRAIVIADGPNTDDTAAQTYREQFDDARLYLIDPGVKVADANGNAVNQPASGRVAGIIAKSDAERGFWHSPSNRPVAGILGTTRAVDFAMGDPNARANLLNEKEIATIIFQNGYRLWGNRTTASDPKFAFISTRRIADLINDSLLRSHLWAVDQNITATYIQTVVDGVNNYLNYLKSLGAIIGGRCWADPEINTPDQILQGKVTFDFDFTPPYPAENITFRSRLVNSYLEEVI